MNALTCLHAYTNTHMHTHIHTHTHIQGMHTYKFKEHLDRPEVFMDNEPH